MTVAQRLARLFPPGQVRPGYIYLAEFSVPLVYVFFVSGWRLAIGLALLAVFIAIYILSLWFAVTPRSSLLFIGVETALMMTMAAAVYPAYFTMLFYPAALIGVTLKNRLLSRTIAAFCLLGTAEAVLLIVAWHGNLDTWWPLILGGVMATLITTFGTRSQRRNIDARRALARANHEIERLTKDAERARISQDLHDVMGHELSMITLKAQLAVRLLDRDMARARSEMKDVERAARQALSRVREYITGMRNADLSEEWESAARTLETAGVQCRVRVSPDVLAGGTGAHQVLAMCLREAVTNMVRHSRSRRAELHLCRDGDEFQLVVADDGVGITTPLLADDHDAASERTPPEEGHGLSGIRMRLAAVGGRLDVWSQGRHCARLSSADTTALMADPAARTAQAAQADWAAPAAPAAPAAETAARGSIDLPPVVPWRRGTTLCMRVSAGVSVASEEVAT